MVAPQDFRDFIRSILRHVFRKGRSKDTLKIGDGKQSFHDGGVRSQYDIVLILSHRVVPFGFEHTDHPERYLVEADDFPYRIASVRKEVVHNRLTDHADLSRTLYVGFCKHVSGFYAQLADFQILQSDTADR